MGNKLSEPTDLLDCEHLRTGIIAFIGLLIKDSHCSPIPFCFIRFYNSGWVKYREYCLDLMVIGSWHLECILAEVNAVGFLCDKAIHIVLVDDDRLADFHEMVFGKYLMPDLQRNHYRDGLLSSTEMDGSEVTAYIYICDFWQSYSFGTFLIVNKQVFFVWQWNCVSCL